MKLQELDNLIYETYSAILSEDGTQRVSSLPDSVKKSLEDRYGEIHEKDFISSDFDTYYKTDSIDKETGGVTHKIIQLPSFFSMYKDFAKIVDDIKKIKRSPEIRTDKAARELFELIKSNFRKLQRYLREERPEQYELIRMRQNVNELAIMLAERINVLTEQAEHRHLLNESLLDELEEAEETEEPTPEEEPDTDAPKETVLEDATDKILGRFPTLKTAIIKLQTEEFKEFVETIDWVSPRPTTFRVNLKNGQDYILKWTGKSFEAQIMGKRYLLSNIAEYQQALDKLSLLYREAPMKGAGEGEGADTDTGGGGGGGGEFPGEEGGGGGEDLGGDDLGGDDLGGDEAGGEDLTDEPIDFEEPGEEPEA